MLLDSALGVDFDVFNADFSLDQFRTALFEVSKIPSQQAFRKQQDPYGPGILVKRLVLELHKIQDFKDYWKRLFLAIWRATNSPAFIVEEQQYLKNLLWRNFSWEVLEALAVQGGEEGAWYSDLLYELEEMASTSLFSGDEKIAFNP
jgi:hypothetical protein